MSVNHDFKELLQELNAAEARYLLVGAYAVIFHTEPRYTKDLDVWIDRNEENVERVWRALAAYGTPLESITRRDLAAAEIIFQIGIEPNRIDILTSIAGLEFEAAFERRVETTYGGEPTSVLNLDDVIAAKTASGRPQDQLDLVKLERARALARKP